jgi:hypothetical protein
MTFYPAIKKSKKLPTIGFIQQDKDHVSDQE